MPRTIRLLVTIEMDDDDDRSGEAVRGDIERELSGDLADVALLGTWPDTDADLTATPANPAAPQRASAARLELTAYLAAVITALIRNDPAVQPYLSPICPECDQMPQPQDGIHVVLGAAVVIGCEGYWIINPNVVGIPNPNWQPQE